LRICLVQFSDWFQQGFRDINDIYIWSHCFTNFIVERTYKLF
jgi:hypothetical protein